MKHKKILLVIPILIIAILSSCIDMEATISFEEDGSGSLTMFYSVSRMVTDLGKLDEKDPFIPLPLTEDDFTATAALSPGLNLVSVKEKKGPKTVDITAKMEFDSGTALSSFFSPDDPGNLTIIESGEETTFRYVLFTAVPGEMNQQSLDMVNSFFADNTLTLKIEAPADIVSVNLGSSNGRDAELQVSIKEIFQNNKDLVWEVRW
jgi:hypothetical protein